MKKKILILISVVSIAFTARAQWTIDSVNTAGVYPYSAATSAKAVFSNGGEWNVFDANNNTHTFGNLSINRGLVKVVSYGEKVYLGGGKYGYFTDPQYANKVDVYDATTDAWSTLTLTKNREVGGAGAAANKIVFAGGTGRSDISGPVNMYNTADIFDATTGVRTTGKLSKARSNIAVGASGNKIVFAGGWYWDINYNVLSANSVDIYDASTDIWTKTTLSKKRENIAVAVVGSKIIFAGGTGGNSGGALADVDIYDVSTDLWSTTLLPTARYSMKSVVVGTNAYFAGGSYDPVENEVDIYNTVANSWSTIYLPVALNGYAMSVINDKIYFSGGYVSSTSSYSNLVQIYDPVTSVWSTEYLSVARNGIAALTVTNKGYFAGGYIAYGYPIPVSTKRVDILSTSSPIADFTASATVVTEGGFANFTDQSSNNPTSWAWTFNGGIPATSTDQNPANIQYNTAGVYDVTLTSTNSQGSSTITKVGYITVNVAPCLPPSSGLAATNITATSATLNWNAVGNATKYKVSWKISGNNPWITTTITTTSYMATGLLANTKYLWKVKSVCGSSVNSSFSPNQSFTTLPGKMALTDVASAISIHPNPATDQVTIIVSQELLFPINCFVYDANGKMVKEILLNNYSQVIDVSDLVVGNYFVRIIDGKNFSVGMKLIKQ